MAPFLKGFNKLVDFLAGLSCVMLVFIVLSITYQVIGRFFFNIAPMWVNCMVEFCLLWLTFFGATYVLRKEKHIEVDLFISGLSQRQALLLKIVTSFVGSAVCLVLTYYSAIVVWSNYLRGINVLKAMETPKSLVLFPIFVGSLLLSIQFVIRGVSLIKVFSRPTGENDLQESLN